MDAQIKPALSIAHISWRVSCFFSLAIYYYRWSQDPFTQGSYSEHVVGFTSEDLTKLGQNLGRLYFGGEATSAEWYGYMQEAYLTGEQKGKLIACQILPSDSECEAAEKKKTKNEATLAARSAAGVLASVVQRLDNTIHRINRYSADRR